MLDHFLQNIRKNFPTLEHSTTLLAVSGGMDSVVMTHLFAGAGLSFAIAHCNFGLRGKESDEDQAFVQALSDQYQVAFHTISFDTLSLAAEKRGSIQMVARELRYEWLEKVRVDHQYDTIATAHHLDDTIETIFLNQIRGSGLRGLLGIPPENNRIIRPLMPFDRAKIKAYVQKTGIAFREDSSNQKDDYQRNLIRHRVLPVLREVNPGLENTFRNNISIWTETVYLLDWASRQLRNQYVSEKNDILRVDFSFVHDHPQAALSLLWEWLAGCHFHRHQLQQALQSIGTEAGAQWFSSTHRILLDREAFFISKKLDHEAAGIFLISEPEGELNLKNGCLRVARKDQKMDPPLNPNLAYLDADRIAFPLEVRHWVAGDFFYPLGMKGKRKKIQDFFTDNKINRFEKEKIWLVLDRNGQIIWVVGYRIDDRFKIEEKTRRTLILQFETETQI